MSKLSPGDVALALPVESLKCLHVVGECSLFQGVHDCLMDWQKFLKFV